MRKVEPEQILEELAGIAFAAPGEEGAPPVKMADKLRALEILYKALAPDAGAGAAVTIIDDVGAVPGGGTGTGQPGEGGAT